MSKRKICVVTGTRAEYGLLYWLMRGLKSDPDIILQIVATGMHLSPEFGLTYRQIEADGFVIDNKVEMLLSSDSSSAISKSLGLGVIGMSDAYTALAPDLVVLLGDRFEILAAATAATIARIPIAHCHGGETTEGAFDEAIRHSVTKMSHLHFTSNEVHRKRVIQLGEHPTRVFNVGALGIENIARLKLLDKAAFEASIDFKLGEKNVLVTFHPVTLETSSAAVQFKALLKALDSLENTNIIFTKANADTDGRIINQMIDEYVSKHQERTAAFTSLGQLRYLSALQFMDVIVGNSSSGILEVPSFKKPTVNIGDRQKGRLQAASVINCLPGTEAIREAVNEAFSEAFQKRLPEIENPYSNGNPSEKILAIVKTAPLQELLKKQFYDL